MVNTYMMKNYSMGTIHANEYVDIELDSHRLCYLPRSDTPFPHITESLSAVLGEKLSNTIRTGHIAHSARSVIDLKESSLASDLLDRILAFYLVRANG